MCKTAIKLGGIGPMERKLIAVAVSSALALPMAAQAVEFAVSGHINRAIVSIDGTGADNDGDLKHKDGRTSPSRFRFTGSEELDSGMTVGVNLEYDAGASPDPDKPDDDNDTPFTRRHSNLYLGGEWGKLTVGQASTATDGMAFANLGGPSWLAGVTNSCAFYSDGPACESNDGGRKDILRYDTPALGPASIAVSSGNNDYWDIMLKVAGSLGDAGYDFRVGHIAETDTDVAATDGTVSIHTGRDLIAGHTNVKTLLDDLPDGGTVALSDATDMPFDGSTELVANQLYEKRLPGTPASKTMSGDITTASLGVAFGQGTSVWTAWSQDDTGDDEYQYISVDHSYGDGSVGVFYKTAEKAGVDGSIRGVGFGHAIGGGATVYAGFRQHEEDGKEDVDVMLAGIRVTFN